MNTIAIVLLLAVIIGAAMILLRVFKKTSKSSTASGYGSRPSSGSQQKQK